MLFSGVMARTVEDVIMFDDIFSECKGSREQIQLKGSRLGYPVNYWEDLDAKVKPASSHGNMLSLVYALGVLNHMNLCWVQL